MDEKRKQVRDYLWGLQQRITDTFGAIDGKPFEADAWRKEPGEPLQGEGRTMILEQGAVFERAGCAFSQVTGRLRTNRAGQPGAKSDVVVHLELVRVRAEADRVDLVRPLVLDPGLDEVLGEHVALGQVLVVALEPVEDSVQ